MSETIYIDGHTANGQHVVVRESDDRLVIEVDGQPAELRGRPRVLRDGGTRHWLTTLGSIVKRHRLDGDRRAFIDGDEIVAQGGPR